MITLRNLILGALLLGVPAWAQTPIDYIASSGNVSVSGATYAVTLQQPPANQLPIQFPAVPGVGASVYCSVACTLSVIRSTGSAGEATTTTGTVSPVQPNSPPAKVLLYTASNYSGGTTQVVINIAAGQTYPLDMSPTRLGGANDNITLALASLTGTVNITFYPQEIH